MNKFVEFKIDKVRKFRLGMMAQKRIEDKFNKAFGKIDHENLRVEDFAFMIWSCLDQADREKTEPDQFLEILDENLSLKEIYELFGKITEAAFGKNVINPEPQMMEEPDIENGIGNGQYATL
jgi:hypothetical protein